MDDAQNEEQTQEAFSAWKAEREDLVEAFESLSRLRAIRPVFAPSRSRSSPAHKDK